MTKIACIADTHCSAGLTPASLSLFPRYVAMRGADGERFFERAREEIERAFQACLGSMRGKRYDRIIHAGDLTGGWQERGMHHPQTREIAARTMAQLRAISPDVLCVVGNHDTGYRKAASLRDDAAEMESLEACREILGPLWWRRRDGDMLSLGICSSVAGYGGGERRLQRARAEQTDFVEAALSGHHGRPWTLYTHDLTAVGPLSPHLLPRADECKAVVYGDLHRPLSGALFQALYRLRRPALSPLIRKAVLCPSTAPLWWEGYGRLDVTYAGGAVRTERIAYPRPADSENLPTESAAWCAAAMVAPRIARLLERAGIA